MATGIFKGPKGALIFVGMTMLGVVMLVGTEEDQGALVMAADELGRESAGLQGRDLPPASQTIRRTVQPARRIDSTIPDDPAFASDEDLIDDASGFDPTPEPIVPFDNTAGNNSATIVESYGEFEVR